MLVYVAKLKGTHEQYYALDGAIRTGQFIRNSCLRYWMDNRDVGKKEMFRYNTQLRNDPEFPWARQLNSHACQASVERAWFAITRFYDNCKKGKPGKKGYPKFKKNTRSVEYKTSGWKLNETRDRITFGALWYCAKIPSSPESRVKQLTTKVENWGICVLQF